MFSKGFHKTFKNGSMSSQDTKECGTTLVSDVSDFSDGKKELSVHNETENQSSHSLWTIDDYESFWGQYTNYMDAENSQVPSCAQITKEMLKNDIDAFQGDNVAESGKTKRLSLSEKPRVSFQTPISQVKLYDSATDCQIKTTGNDIKDTSPSKGVYTKEEPLNIFERLAARLDQCQVKDWLLQSCQQGDPKAKKMTPCLVSTKKGMYGGYTSASETSHATECESGTSIDDNSEEITLNLEHNKSQDTELSAAEKLEARKVGRLNPNALQENLTSINISIARKKRSTTKSGNGQDVPEDISHRNNSNGSIQSTESDSVRVTYRRTAPSLVSSSSAQVFNEASESDTTIIDSLGETVGNKNKMGLSRNTKLHIKPVVRQLYPRRKEPPKGGPNFAFYAKLTRPRLKQENPEHKDG